MRFILGAMTAAAIAGVAFVQPAEARCFWNGFDTVCVHHHSYPMLGGYRDSYRGFDRSYRDYDRPIHGDGGY